MRYSKNRERFTEARKRSSCVSRKLHSQSKRLLLLLGVGILTTTLRLFFGTDYEAYGSSLPGLPFSVGTIRSDETSQSSEASSKEVFAVLKPWGNTHAFAPSNSLSIFYNAYINPKNSKTIDIMANVIREQLEIVGGSPYRTSTLYMNVVGHNSSIGNLCPKGMDCRLMRYYAEGFEEVTLTELHSYCQQYPTHRVAYLHDKGSYHRTRNNFHKRSSLTRQISSAACNKMKSRGCNVCTNRFQPLPHWHSMGNMWVAECSYIRLLHSPYEFAARRWALFDHLMDPVHRDKNACLRGYFVTDNERDATSMRDYEDRLGNIEDFFLGRFISETWVWSHPFLIPCDVSNNTIYSAPRVPFHELPVFKRKGVHGTRARSELYRYKGLLFQFQYMYSQRPPQGSWFWEYYKNTVDADPPCPYRPTDRQSAT